MIAAASVGRLFADGAWGHALGPLVATASVGSAVPSLMAFRRIPTPIRAVSGTIAMMLVSLWTTAPGSTTFGLPTARTWRVLEVQLRSARPVLGRFVIPLRPLPGVVLLAVLTAGAVAVLASVLLHCSDDADRLYPGLALLCPFGLLAFVCTRTVSSSLAVPVVLFVAAGAFTLTTTPAEPVRDPASAGSHRLSTAAVLTISIMACVTVLALVVGPISGGAGSPGAGATAIVPPTALSLTSNLVALEVNDANVVLFRAHSPYRTYWQVAVLNVLRSGVWVPDPGTLDAARGAPQNGLLTQPPLVSKFPGTPTFASNVRIEDLSSRLLPVPPSTYALSGTTATITGSGAVSSFPTTPGQQYLTTSAVPTTDPGADAGNGSVSTYPQALVRAETALPALPANIELLSRAATVGAQTPLGQAEALVNWFRSGRFKYTLTPPPTAPGDDPLVSFLTQTRSGTCEQFAGAFTVLARTLGLPTRLVVGFTAGRYSGPNEVTVTGADAHAWPQVYLGPTAGWVSFEPTPQQPSGEVAPEGVVGPTGVETIVPPPTLSPSPTSPSLPATLPTTVPTSVSQATGSAAAAPSSSGPEGLAWAVISVAGLLLVVLAVIGLLRRRKWSPAGRTPSELSLLAQAEVDRALRRAGVERPPWQPMGPYMEQVIERVADRGDSLTVRPGPDDLGSLLANGVLVARSADRALFDPLPLSPATSRMAYDAARKMKRGLRHQELRWILVEHAPTRPANVNRR